MNEGYRSAIKSILKLCDYFYGVNPETNYLEKLLRYAAKDEPEKVAAYIDTYFERATRLEIQDIQTMRNHVERQEEIDKLRELGTRIMSVFGFDTRQGMYPVFTRNGKEFYTVESALMEWKA